MKRATHWLLPLLTLAGAQLGWAQELPERITVGGEPMTIGFELKTTDKGDGPRGRSSSHTLMDFIVPAAGGEARAQWDQLSRAERTKLFFETYSGGYTSNNYVVDTARFPWADKAVSWYGDALKIPHIEIRSAPFDNPREAMAKIHELRRGVSETIAFHMHLRFPDTGMVDRAEAMTEYLRRTSFAIWLRRADYSSKTDFVLKQADNQAMNPSEMESTLQRLSNQHSSGEIVGRRGLRVNRMSGPNGQPLIDIEFRGLMKDTDRLERYLRATAQAFSAEGEVGPWRFDANNPYRNVEHNLDLQFERTSTWSPRTLDMLVEQMNSAIERHEVQVGLEGEERARAFKALATAETESGKRTLLPSSFNWLFMPLEYDPALPEGIQEQIAAKKRTYLRKLVRLAERVHAGEFGELGSSQYKANKTGSRVRPILYDFVNETYTDGERTAKLFEWFEMSLFTPQETVERTERWRQETGRNRAEEFAQRRQGSGEGFALPRSQGGPLVRASAEAIAAAQDVFARLRQAALADVAEKLTTAEGAERTRLEQARQTLERAGLGISQTNDIRAEWLRPQGEFAGRVGISHGLLRELEAKAGDAATFRRLLGVVTAHEVAHAAGFKAEQAADRAGIELYQRSASAGDALTERDVRLATRAFTAPTGSSCLNDFAARLINMLSWGSTRSRIANMERAVRGEADPLARYRRADGTLEWKRVIGERALAETAGLAHFGLALFLKELAVVGATGDKLRIEEFFDGLASTDFYKHYGMFVVGARAGEAVYARYLQRFIKPRFVQTIAKNNFVLAAGLALPQLASGEFDGRTFVVSLGSLGLSATAVRAGLSRIEWVYELGKAKRASQAVSGASRLARAARVGARVGGWVYTAAELAVVLLAAEKIDQAVNGFLDDRAARGAVADAADALLQVAGDPGATPEQVSEAAAAYHAAWTDFRDFLYQPLMAEEARFAMRLEGAARQAKRADDTREALVANIEGNEALERFALGKHESLRAYAEHLTAQADAETSTEVERYLAAFARDREQGLQDVYQGNRRADGETYLPADADDLFAQALTQGNAFQRRAAERAREALADASRNPTRNRLEAYRDEDVFLAGVQQALRERGDDDAAAALNDVRDLNARTEALDHKLAEGETLLEGPRAGATDALEEIADQARQPVQGR